MIRKIKLVLFLLFLAIVALVSLHFLAENKALMTVHTVVGDFVDVAAGRVLMWVFILGTALGALLGFLPISGYWIKVKRLEKQLARERQRAQHKHNKADAANQLDGNGGDSEASPA